MFCDDFPRLRKTLEQRGYTPHFAATPQEARDMAVALIRQGKSVGPGRLRDPRRPGHVRGPMRRWLDRIQPRGDPPIPGPGYFSKGKFGGLVPCFLQRHHPGRDADQHRRGGQPGGRHVCRSQAGMPDHRPEQGGAGSCGRLGPGPQRGRAPERPAAPQADPLHPGRPVSRLQRASADMPGDPASSNTSPFGWTALHLILVDADLGY